MNTINGVSPDIPVDSGSYGADGGIALYGARDGGGTIVGGSGDDGQVTSFARIYWTITNDGNDNITGGITGGVWTADPWFRQTGYSGPFDSASDLDLWNTASSTGTLQNYFIDWNNNNNTTNILQFALYVSMHAEDCIDITFG